MKVKNYYKIYYKIVGVIIDSPNTQIHDHSLSWLGTGTSIKSMGLSPKIVKPHWNQFPYFLRKQLAYKPKTSVGFDQLFTDNIGNFI
jgi:hypothetical protein